MVTEKQRKARAAFVKKYAKKKSEYRSFTEARKFARSLGFKKREEWIKFYRAGNLPIDIPKVPQRTYKKDWKNWGDFLGTGYISTNYRKYRSLEEATKFARNLGLKDGKYYKRYYESGKIPRDIPKCPWAVYSKEWKGMGDFLGTGFMAAKYRKFRSFEDQRIFARSLKLDSQTEWQKFCKSGKKPADIHASPRRAFINNGWTNWGDFLGNIGKIANQNRVFWSYEKANAFLIKLGVENRTDFERKYKSGKIPKDIPRGPERVYNKHGMWKSWGDFLGTGRIANQNIMWPSAKKARIEIKKIAKDVFGGKPFSEQDWKDAHDEGKIPKSLPKYLTAIYNPEVRKKRRSAERRRKK